MIYDLSLRTVGIVTGLILLALHLFAFFQEKPVTEALKRFSRSYLAGALLMTAAFIWTFILLATIDLGEISHLRRWFLIGLPIGYVLTLRFVDDFLAVRGLAALLLLVADPLLSSAFLRPEPGRLLLVILAYAWLIEGLFFMGMPHLCRDQINWVTQKSKRWKAATLAGAAYGAVLLILSLATFRP